MKKKQCATAFFKLFSSLVNVVFFLVININLQILLVEMNNLSIKLEANITKIQKSSTKTTVDRILSLNQDIFYTNAHVENLKENKGG